MDGELMTIVEWCRHHNAPYSRVVRRLQEGWNLEEALKLPKRARRRVQVFGV
jgi:hypothetical protein